VDESGIAVALAATAPVIGGGGLMRVEFMSELVSVIIPTYNRASLLPKALACVAAQDYRPLQVVVVDDGSTDGTKEIIPAQKVKLAERGVELVFVSQPNGGPARARNVGFSLCGGNCIAFLDSDDLWMPTAVSTLRRLLSEHPSAGMAFCALTCIDVDDRFIGYRPTRLAPEPREGLLIKPFERFLTYVPTNTSCIMVRRSVLTDVGFFDTTLHIGEDWDLWYRITQKYDAAYTLDASLAKSRDHPGNMPKQDARAIGDRICLMLKHLPQVQNQSVRTEQVGRIQRDIVLLQEQIMRERHHANGYAKLLEHPYAPASFRYRVGSMMRRQPKWIGTIYARIIRALGSLQRNTLGKDA
jgi:glycosyltransferase involved in cell wall biosynthesis